MTWAEESSVLLRAVELRRAGRLPMVLADRGQLYVCGSEVTPWDTRRRISAERLLAMVAAAEARWPERPAAGRVEREWDGWLARRG